MCVMIKKPTNFRVNIEHVATAAAVTPFSSRWNNNDSAVAVPDNDLNSGLHTSETWYNILVALNQNNVELLIGGLGTVGVPKAQRFWVYRGHNL